MVVTMEEFPAFFGVLSGGGITINKKGRNCDCGPLSVTICFRPVFYRVWLS